METLFLYLLGIPVAALFWGSFWIFVQFLCWIMVRCERSNDRMPKS